MCFGSVKAPEPITIEKPVFVRNPFLDEDERNARSADALRRGRSSLVIPGGIGIGFEGSNASAINNLSGGGRRVGPAPTGGGRGVGTISSRPNVNNTGGGGGQPGGPPPDKV